MENLDLPLDLPPSLSLAPSVDDDTLVAQLQILAQREREARADFIVHLAEFDRRRLYLPLGFPSLFAWLTERLRFSNASAFRRATACRLHARMPAVGAYLREGRLSLNKLCHLRDVLTPDNSRALLEQAAQMAEKEVEELALILGSKTSVVPRDSIRPLPPPTRESLSFPVVHKSSAEEVPVSSVAEVTKGSVATGEKRAADPTAGLRHLVKMTVSPEFLSVLERVRAAFSHTHPEASLETLLFECMRLALTTHEKRTRAKIARPRPAQPVAPGSRHIPAHVRRAVWERDEGRCAFVSPDGTRCSATHRLELHHTIPYARGGPATETTLALRCKSHNDLAARADFGNRHMDRFTRRRPSPARDHLAPIACPVGP